MLPKVLSILKSVLFKSFIKKNVVPKKTKVVKKINKYGQRRYGI